MADRYEVRFDSTDDPALDGETTLIEDELQTRDEVVRLCERYGVRAHLIKDGKLVETIIPPSERRVPFREQRRAGLSAG
jgi:hypothetical protein